MENTKKQFSVSDNEARKNGIGGSDAGSVIGLNPYKSAYQVWLEKTGQVEPEDLSENARVYWGTILEPTVAEEYSKRTSNKIRISNKTYYHKKHDFLYAHVDRLINDGKGILEIKTSSNSRMWGAEGSDLIPPQYKAQCLHYLLVTGREYCDLCVLLLDKLEIRTYRVPANKEELERLEEQLVFFWTNNVKKGEKPSLITNDLIFAFPNSNGESIRANGLVQDLVKELKEMKQAKKDYEANIKGLEEQIKFFIGDNEQLTNDQNQKIATWKSQETCKIDSKKLKEQEPEIFQKYSKITKSRVFRTY